MAAYYNEHDAFAAAWLRELIKAGHIAGGDVDERSIEEVAPDDLRGYTQCHFFAGIGVWSYALRNAGWSDTAPVWTGSCPCQPFSAAGKREGGDDKRHLWPAWFRLIRECRPDVCFGEQVANGLGIHWIDIVSADLEGAGYAVGACDLCAAGVGAPHIRQRLWFVAESTGERCREAGREHSGRQAERLGDCGESGDWVGNTYESGLSWICGSREERITEPSEPCGSVGDANGARYEIRVGFAGNDGAAAGQARRQAVVEGSLVSGFWRDAEWIPCRDGKARPVESGTFPLAHRSPARVGRLRGYGNAIVAPAAEAFIRAYLEVRNVA